MEYFAYIGQDREKCFPNVTRYIFSADLVRLTKMFSLSSMHLYILNMCQETASHSLFFLYFFSQRPSAVDKQ